MSLSEKKKATDVNRVVYEAEKPTGHINIHRKENGVFKDDNEIDLIRLATKLCSICYIFG